MTQDFEQFSKHWNRAVNGLVGRISTDSRAIYTRKDMDQMWREELLDWDCREGQTPEELRTALRIYFREHAIEAINYTQDRAELFQVLPANGPFAQSLATNLEAELRAQIQANAEKVEIHIS